MTYEQMITEIQCYIHHIKNIEVTIAMPRNIGEIRKMHLMFKIANEYFKR